MSLLSAYVPTDALVASAVPGVEVRQYSRVGEILDADRTDVLVLPHPLTPDDRSAVAQLRNTHVVQSLTSGVDHLEGVMPPEVRLVGAPCLHAGPTAEWALVLILSMLTLPPDRLGIVTASPGAWTRTGLRGTRVVIVGPGHVGLRLGQMLNGMGSHASYLGRAQTKTLHRAPAVEELRSADVVVLAAPLTSETAGLIDARALAELRDGALLVNVSRGEVVDTDSLVEHLTAGRLHAALDVTHPEPLPDGHPLLSAPNTLLTPHLAGSSNTFERRSIAFVSDQLLRYRTGREMRCRLDGSPCTRGFDL